MTFSFTKMETHSLGSIPSFVAEVSAVKEGADCPGASKKAVNIKRGISVLLPPLDATGALQTWYWHLIPYKCHGCVNKSVSDHRPSPGGTDLSWHWPLSHRAAHGPFCAIKQAWPSRTCQLFISMGPQEQNQSIFGAFSRLWFPVYVVCPDPTNWSWSACSLGHEQLSSYNGQKTRGGASISELSSLPHGADKALEAMSVPEPLTLFKAHCLWAEGEAMERGWSCTPGTPQQWNEPCHRAGSSPQLGVVGCSLGCKFRWFRWPPVCPMALKCFHSLLSAMSHRRSYSRLQCFYDCIVLNYFMWYKEDQGALPVIDISPSSPLVTHIYFNLGLNKVFFAFWCYFLQAMRTVISPFHQVLAPTHLIWFLRQGLTMRVDLIQTGFTVCVST